MNCPDCGHDLEVTHSRTGCEQVGCSCKRNSRGKIAKPRSKRADDLCARLEALAERSRASGPALRELADEASELLLEDLEKAVEHLNYLVDAADTYENSEPGRDGQDEREEAWGDAQGAAEELRAALEALQEALT